MAFLLGALEHIILVDLHRKENASSDGVLEYCLVWNAMSSDVFMEGDSFS